MSVHLGRVHLEPGEVLYCAFSSVLFSRLHLGLSPSLHQEKLTKLFQRAMFLLLCSAPSCQLVNAADGTFGSFFPSSSPSSEFWLVAAVQPDPGLPVRGRSLRLSICFPKPSKIFIECPYCPSWSPLAFSPKVLRPCGPVGRLICRVWHLP